MNDDKINIPELIRTDERFRTFMEESIEAIWRVEFEKPIAIDLQVDEQIEQPKNFDI